MARTKPQRPPNVPTKEKSQRSYLVEKLNNKRDAELRSEVNLLPILLFFQTYRFVDVNFVCHRLPFSVQIVFNDYSVLAALEVHL